MIRLSVPGKTFLLGEYTALKKGPALLVNTAPRFELHAREKLEAVPLRSGIIPAGPVGEFLNDPFFDEWDISFLDRYKGRGGFGASSAQFVLLFALKRHVEMLPIMETELLSTYHRSIPGERRMLPSGYDLLSQLMGRLTFVDRMSDRVDVLEWPFSNLDFVLIRTGTKLPTHEHLAGLSDLKLDSGFFKEPEIALKSIREADEEAFAESIRRFANLLQSHNLVASHTNELLSRLRGHPDLVVAKGCGALGADVMLAVVKSSGLARFQTWATSQGFDCVATSDQLTSGLKIEVFSKESAPDSSLFSEV